MRAISPADRRAGAGRDGEGRHRSARARTRPFTLTLGELPSAARGARRRGRRRDERERRRRSRRSSACRWPLPARSPASGTEGVVVTGVDPNGAAAERGFKTGDVILEVAGKPCRQPGRCAQGARRRAHGRQAHRADAREVRRGHPLRRACRSARGTNRTSACASSSGRAAGNRRPRRWRETRGAGLKTRPHLLRPGRPAIPSPPPDPGRRGAAEVTSPPPPSSMSSTRRGPVPHVAGSPRYGDRRSNRVHPNTMRLLIIEDDRDAADYLVKAFREVGHVADHAPRTARTASRWRSTAITTC